MSRPYEARREYLKTRTYVWNFTLRTRTGYSLNKIVDSLKGIEGIKIVSSKQIKDFTYDFIINFQTRNEEEFNKKWYELIQILNEDFKKTNIIEQNTWP
jgi:hypothetical protein